MTVKQGIFVDQWELTRICLGLIQAPPLEENERAQGRINPELVAGRNTRARLIRARFQ